MIKPAKPARENISPSDLTFRLSTCKRCLWIKYWYKVTMPGAFPLVGTMAALQEEHFQDCMHTLQVEVSRTDRYRAGYLKLCNQLIR